MADTTFVDQVTHIVASWLNAINISVYRAIGAGGVAPTTPAEVRTNLGLTAVTGAALIGFSSTGTVAAATVQAAIAEVDSEKAPKASPTFTGTVTSEGPVVVENVLQVNGMLSAFGIDPPSVVPYPDGFSAWSGRFNRLASSGGTGTVKAAVNVMTQTAAGTTSLEWNQLNRLENYANAGENVAFYAQAYKHAAGPTWAGVFESHDTTHTTPSAALYGIEVDISANGDDVSGGYHQRLGVSVVGYRDDGPDAYITASTLGTVMTVTAVASGTIVNGAYVSGEGIADNTTISSFGTGVGGVGTYNLSTSQTTSSATKITGGGAVNKIGYGILVTPADADPWATKFYYGVLCKNSGDVGFGHIGAVAAGVHLSGTYSSGAVLVYTTSTTPIINSIGSANGSLWKFASTDPVWSGAALGAYAGKIKVIVDGVDKWMPVYA